TGILCGDFSDLHRYVEKIMGRPVFTHEMGNSEIYDQIKKRSKDDFLAICEAVCELPKDKQ
ncbi:MAG: hypothetical protein OQK29_06665, partial [Ignavibacteriaceae bacterium]|nr:hypothetical protein [Ignavibacteriaceae bacterium]